MSTLIVKVMYLESQNVLWFETEGVQDYHEVLIIGSFYRTDVLCTMPLLIGNYRIQICCYIYSSNQQVTCHHMFVTQVQLILSMFESLDKPCKARKYVVECWIYCTFFSFSTQARTYIANPGQPIWLFHPSKVRLARRSEASKGTKMNIHRSNFPLFIQ